MSKLCIVYGYHGTMTAVMTKHFNLFKQHNPEADVMPVSFKTQPIPADWSTGLKLVNESLECDLMLYRFFELNPGYDKYLFAEWDVYCNQSVRDFIGAAYDKDAVGATVVYPDKLETVVPGYPTKQKDWGHFWSTFTSDNAQYLEEFRPSLRGIIPAGFTLFSNRALAAILLELRHPAYQRMFCECRLGTAATRAGYEPVSYDPGNAHKKVWCEYREPNGTGIFHICKK